jgi:hypothetical protein
MNLSVAVLLAATGGKHVPLRFSLCCKVVCTVRGYRQDGVLPCGRSVSFLALSGLQAELSGGRNVARAAPHLGPLHRRLPGGFSCALFVVLRWV